MWTINTSNKGKLEEFRSYLGNVKAITDDLPEPDSDPLTVIRYKASQFENVLVDDTSLEVEGIDIGVNIRWLIDKLDECTGKKATFTCLLGLHKEGKVFLYRGVCKGSIVKPIGDSFGFNRYFKPDEALKTFGQEIPDHLNPRKLAIDSLINGSPWKILDPLKSWDGKFQS